MKHACHVWCLGFAAACLLTPRGATAQQGLQTAPPSRVTAGAPAARAGGTDNKGVVTSEYLLGPGDKLRIEVYKDPQMSQSVQVRPDGKVTLPLVGDLEASGRTPVELRDTVTRALKEYMNNPVVTVIVVEATAATAYVVGGVAHPGAVPVLGHLTVLQALAMAGGLTDFADRKNIRVLRKGVGGRCRCRNARRLCRRGCGEQQECERRREDSTGTMHG
jgi:polysaccharide export outer membrane protein